MRGRKATSPPSPIARLIAAVNALAGFQFQGFLFFESAPCFGWFFGAVLLRLLCLLDLCPFFPFLAMRDLGLVFFGSDNENPSHRYIEVDRFFQPEWLLSLLPLAGCFRGPCPLLSSSARHDACTTAENMSGLSL